MGCNQSSSRPVPERMSNEDYESSAYFLKQEEKYDKFMTVDIAHQGKGEKKQNVNIPSRPDEIVTVMRIIGNVTKTNDGTWTSGDFYNVGFKSSK